MEPAVKIRVLGVEDWADWRAMRLRALAEAPDAFGSTLAGWTGANDLEERWRQRLAEVEFNVLADLEDSPVGMVSAAVSAPAEVELLSMWVAPEARGRGIGDALVQAVMGWAAEAEAHRVVLGVRQANAHAIALYCRHGFDDLGPYGGPEGPWPPERCMARSVAGRT